MAVSAIFEDSNATGINGDQTDNSATSAGAVYIFERSAGTWSQTAYIKGSNTEAVDAFGRSLSLSQDGLTLAVGAQQEDSSATGINGVEADNSAVASGAAYVFVNSGGVWSQQAYVKASNTESNDLFGSYVTLSSNGNRLVVGAHREASNATGIDGDQTNNSEADSGAVYIFDRSGTSWSQAAYVKASNSEAGDQFGYRLDLSGDGNTLAVSAIEEGSSATGVGGDQTDNSALESGAAYVFSLSGGTWSQEAYIKSSNTEAADFFGGGIALNFDGSLLAVAAPREDSDANGIGGDQSDNSAISAGAVYYFAKSSSWTQFAYLKGLSSDTGDLFGGSTSTGAKSLEFSADGDILVIGSYFEDGSSIGVGGDPTDNSASASGAVFVFEN